MAEAIPTAPVAPVPVPVAPVAPAPVPAAPPVAPAPPPPAGGGGALFAGKYATPEDLEKGVHEAREHLGLTPHVGPAFGPGGMYNDVAAMESGYLDFQNLISRAPAAVAPVVPIPGQPPVPGTPTPPVIPGQPTVPGIKIPDSTVPVDPNIEQVLLSAGLKAEDLYSEWGQKGTLRQDQYDALQKAGHGRQIVDGFISGQMAVAQQNQALQTQAHADAVAIVGGEEQLTNLLAWAKTGLDPSTIVNLDERLANPAHYRGALQQIQAAQQVALGATGSQSLVEGQPPVGATTIIDSLDKMNEMTRKAQQGDPAALAAVNAVTPEQLSNFS